MCWRGLFLGIVALAFCSGTTSADEVIDPEEAAPDGPFGFAGNIELVYERLRNFDLDSGTSDDLDSLEVDAAFGFLFAPSDNLFVYLQPNLTREIPLRDQRGDEDRVTEFGFEEAYLTVLDRELGLSLQMGRSAFVDERGWLFDEELDAIRGHFQSEASFLELSASREELVDVDLLNPDDIPPIVNYIAYGGLTPGDHLTVGAYGILRDHLEQAQTRPLFLGAFAKGSIDDNLAYWLDIGHVRGRDAGRRIEGYGADLLGVYTFDLDYAPRFVLGYAFATGDSDPHDGKDENFRQTGLQGEDGNEVELGGQTALKYLGEAFVPELSNLSVFTAGLGASPCEGCSIDIVYHYYLQDEASPEIRRSALDTQPIGRDRELGQEVDLVVGYEAFEGFELRGFLGYFEPGKAFAAGADGAFLARVELEFDF